MFTVLKSSRGFKAYWLRYTTAIVLLLIVNVIEMFPPKLLGNAIDDMKAGVFTKAGCCFTYVFSRINGSRLFTVLFLDVSAFRRGECHGEDSPFKADGKASSNVTAVLREIQNGRFNGAGTNDLHTVSMTTGFGVLTLIDSTMYMLTIFLTMGLLISWKLTFAAIIPLPIMAAAVSLYGKRSMSGLRKRRMLSDH